MATFPPKTSAGKPSQGRVSRGKKGGGTLSPTLAGAQVPPSDYHGPVRRGARGNAKLSQSGLATKQSTRAKPRSDTRVG